MILGSVGVSSQAQRLCKVILCKEPLPYIKLILSRQWTLFDPPEEPKPERAKKRSLARIGCIASKKKIIIDEVAEKERLTMHSTINTRMGGA